MKLNEVTRGIVVLHQRQNQGHLRTRAKRKVGVVLTDELFCSARSSVADLVEVEFVVDGRRSVDRVRYNKLQVLPQSERPTELAELVPA